MTEEKNCGNCRFYRVESEYWHDHYLIPEHHFCIFDTRYSRDKEVDPDRDTCEHYQSIPKSRGNA